MKITISLVTFNCADYIPYIFASLREQSFVDWEIWVIDNNSTDGTVQLLEKELSSLSNVHRLIKNTENRGFAGAHNQAWRESTGEYFLVLNPDMYLDQNCLKKMVESLDSHSVVAAVAPRLMKWDFRLAANNLTSSFTDVVDALGLKVFRSRRVLEQFGGLLWSELKKQYIWPDLSVFGLSGTCVLYRRSSIIPVLENGELYDESFGTYKEDVDLAFRLCALKLDSSVILDAVAYHNRGSSGPENEGDAAALANRKRQSEKVRFQSYRNHFFMLYKNELWQNFTLDFPWILWYETKKFIYNLIFERRVLAGISEFWRARPVLRQKRETIRKNRTATWRDMRRWWI